jgi:hypothetical protein
VVAGGRGEASPCHARTRPVLVFLSFHCGEDPFVEGNAARHFCWALGKAALGVGDRHSGLFEAVSPHVLQTETGQPLQQTCTHEDERIEGPVGGEGSQETAWEAGYSSATRCLGYCCSGCEGHRGALETHRRLGGGDCLFAAQARGGYVTSVIDSTAHWQHGETAEGCEDQ